VRITVDSLSQDTRAAGEALRRSRYFEGVPEEQLQKLLALASVRRYDAGQVILRQGEPNTEVYVLLRGRVAVKVDGRLICHLRRRGDIFGETGVLSGQSAGATVEAAEPVEALALCVEKLRRARDEGGQELHSVFFEWLARVLAGQLHLASEKAKLHEDLSQQLRTELDAARQVQEEVLFSNLTSIPGVPLVVRYEPAATLGGDLYGVLPLGGSRYALFVGDVSGHGTSSALLSVAVLSHLQDLSRAHDAPARVLNALNGLWLAGLPRGRFVTLLYAVYDTGTREFAYANAGHPPPLVIRRGEVFEPPSASGVPLGLFERDIAVFREGRGALETGDRLVLYTDGVLEALSRARGASGVADLRACLQDHAGLSSREIAQAVYAHRRRRHVPAADDFTLLVLEQAGR